MSRNPEWRADELKAHQGITGISESKVPGEAAARSKSQLAHTASEMKVTIK
jgi:hypothetical protein